jgi:hypothetical protein
LESVKSQAYENWECIVVDDASTDSSVGTAWEIAGTDERIRVVRHTRNAGLSAARNTGLRLARGEWVTFVDSDDFLTEDSLSDRIRHLIPHVQTADVAGVFGGAVLAPADAVPRDYRRGRTWSRSPADFVTSGDHCPFNVHAVLARTSVLLAAGGFDESMLHGAEDWDLWYRVMRNGFRFEPSGLASAIYRQKPTSMRQRHALEHFLESQRLTESSQHDAEATIAFQGAVPPMLRSKGDYETSARLARRSIQSAATSLLAGDENGAVEVLSAVEPVHPAVLARHVRPETAVSDGFRRYLGLTTGELAHLRPQLGPLSERAADLVAEHLRIASIEVEPRRADLDVLLVPQNAYQLSQMLDVVMGADLSAGVVDSSAAAGDQGVADRLKSRPPDSAALLSYNEASLGRTRARVVVVSSPRDAAVDELALRLVADGASVVALGSDLESSLRIDDAHPSRVPVRQMAPAELAAACRDGDIESVLRDEDTQPRSASDAPAYRDAAHAWTIEEYPDRGFDGVELARFEGLHTGERVVIIGNGPSLNDLDLSLLRGTRTIGVNGIFYADDRLPEPLSYYVVEDTMVVRDNLERIKAYDAGHRFFPSIYRDMIGESANTTFFMMNRGFYEQKSPAYCVPRFSTNPAQRIYAGQSVTAMNLQLAYYMGFDEVILIGMDFSYTVPDSSQVDGVLITSMGDDPNHFHPDYFGKGKVWKDPKLDRVLANYALAKQMFESDGRRIINATPGGRLELFDRVPFDDLFGR